MSWPYVLWMILVSLGVMVTLWGLMAHEEEHRKVGR